jgi:hypothetical protein
MWWLKIVASLRLGCDIAGELTVLLASVCTVTSPYSLRLQETGDSARSTASQKRRRSAGEHCYRCLGGFPSLSPSLPKPTIRHVVQLRMHASSPLDSKSATLICAPRRLVLTVIMALRRFHGSDRVTSPTSESWKAADLSCKPHHAGTPA